jgi:hypothetical protein
MPLGLSAGINTKGIDAVVLTQVEEFVRSEVGG